jgi:hypothetical protein
MVILMVLSFESLRVKYQPPNGDIISSPLISMLHVSVHTMFTLIPLARPLIEVRRMCQ